MGRSGSSDIEENKLFIRGVTDDVDEEMINAFFSKFGRVTEGNIVLIFFISY